MLSAWASPRGKEETTVRNSLRALGSELRKEAVDEERWRAAKPVYRPKFAGGENGELRTPKTRMEDERRPFGRGAGDPLAAAGKAREDLVFALAQEWFGPRRSKLPRTPAKSSWPRGRRRGKLKPKEWSPIIKSPPRRSAQEGRLAKNFADGNGLPHPGAGAGAGFLQATGGAATTSRGAKTEAEPTEKSWIRKGGGG